MPRLPYLPQDLSEPADIVSAIRKRRGGKLNEADRITLYSPAFAQGWNAIALAVRQELSVSPKLRELAICSVGALNGADYEVDNHAPVFYAAGGKEAQVKALRNFEAAMKDTALFDASERATLRLTFEMTRNVAISDETFAAVRAVLPSPQQVVELVGTIAFYNMIARFLVALQVNHE